ncbi:MAG: hypothetical protein RI894_1127 [Bacteroidota bacterium]|jgi:hypothetical protein
MKTIVVSSSMTLAIKYILPAMGLGLLLPFFVFLFSADSANYSGAIPVNIFRLVALAIPLSIFFLWRISVQRLMRVEVDAEYVYVSNYFETVRYTYSSVERIANSGFLIFDIVTIHLKAKGQFGTKIRFWAGSSWQETANELPLIQECFKTQPPKL